MLTCCSLSNFGRIQICKSESLPLCRVCRVSIPTRDIPGLFFGPISLLESIFAHSHGSAPLLQLLHFGSC